MASNTRSEGDPRSAGGGTSSPFFGPRGQLATGSQASTPVNRPFRDARSLSRLSRTSSQATATPIRRPSSQLPAVSSRASASSTRLPIVPDQPYHRSVARLSSSSSAVSSSARLHANHGRHGHQSASRPSSSASAVSRIPQPISSQVDRNDEEDDGFDGINEVIMALDMRNDGTLGCAYYVAIDEALFLQEDIPMADLQMVQTMLLRIQPTTVAIPNRSKDDLLEFVQNHSQDMYDRSGGQNLRGAYVLKTLVAAEFNYDSAVEKLVGLELEHENRQTMGFAAVTDHELDVPMGGYSSGLSKHNRRMRLATLINLDSRTSVSCAGAVLSEIDLRKASGFFANDPAADFAFRIRSIEMFMLADSMFMNADALRSLQIIGSESHPNAQLQGPKNSGAKEGLSLYGLFHFLAVTNQGKKKLRQLFLRPTMDLQLIQERHRTIAVLLRPENGEIVDSMVKALKKINNIRPHVTEVHKGVIRRTTVRNTVWATFQRFAIYSMVLRDTVGRINGKENMPIVARLMEGIRSHELGIVGEAIANTLDLVDGPPGQQITVRPGVDPELDEMRRVYAGLEHLLTEATVKLREELPAWAHQYVTHCIFFPQLGFLTSVLLDADGRPTYEGEGVQHDMWDQMYKTDTAMFYKNRRMRELDSTLGDVYTRIGDREVELIHELGLRVLQHEDALIEASDLAGEIDCLLALANGAERYKLKAPQMTTVNVIAIEGGRHLLQELVVPSFVPNHCNLVGGQGEDDDGDNVDLEGPSMLVMTGPNHSGKSVYIKQNALIVYMAQIGSFVPAERSVIGLTDKILTRIATRESVSLNESAFAIDLRQAAFSTNFATHRSLVLIDEFGKGTDPTSGASLMAAVLCEFLERGGNRPKVLAATHFHEIFENRLVRARPELAFAHMITETADDRHSDDDPITFLYQLEMGRSNESLGTRCAAMNGVDRAIIEEADRLAEVQLQGGDVAKACCLPFEEEVRDLQRAEEVGRRFMEMDVVDGMRSSGAPQSARAWLAMFLDV